MVIAAARRFTVELLHLVELFAEITGPHLGAVDKTVAELFLLQQILLDSLRIAAARQGFKDGHGCHILCRVSASLTPAFSA